MFTRNRKLATRALYVWMILPGLFHFCETAQAAGPKLITGGGAVSGGPPNSDSTRPNTGEQKKEGVTSKDVGDSSQLVGTGAELVKNATSGAAEKGVHGLGDAATGVSDGVKIYETYKYTEEHPENYAGQILEAAKGIGEVLTDYGLSKVAGPIGAVVPFLTSGGCEGQIPTCEERLHGASSPINTSPQPQPAHGNAPLPTTPPPTSVPLSNQPQTSAPIPATSQPQTRLANPPQNSVPDSQPASDPFEQSAECTTELATRPRKRGLSSSR